MHEAFRNIELENTLGTSDVNVLYSLTQPVRGTHDEFMGNPDGCPAEEKM